MNITELQSFLAVVEYHSISLASKKMHVSQPALSKRIQKLEAKLGVQLIRISKVGAELTEQGKQCIPYLRQILYAHEELMKQLKGEKSYARAMINVGVTVYVEKYLCSSLLNYLKSINDNLFISIKLLSEVGIKDKLSSGRVDVIIAPKRFTFPKEVTAISLWREKLLPVAAKSHPIHLQKNLTFKSLATYDAVLMDTGATLRLKVEEFSSNKDVAINVLYEANTVFTNIDLVERGVGWSVIYERLLRPDILPIQVDDWDVCLDFCCYYLTKRKDDRIVGHFLDGLTRFVQASEEFQQFAESLL